MNTYPKGPDLIVLRWRLRARCDRTLAWEDLAGRRRAGRSGRCCRARCSRIRSRAEATPAFCLFACRGFPVRPPKTRLIFFKAGKGRMDETKFFAAVRWGF